MDMNAFFHIHVRVTTMSYRRTLFALGLIFHVYNRGAGQMAIFLCDRDYGMFMRFAREEATRHGMAIIAIVLMPNHFHIVLQPIEGNANVSEFMRCLQYRYARWFNKQYKRSGTLFEGRFKDKHVDSDEYLYQVCRYVHANPVVAGLATAPERWKWSNFLEFIGQRNEMPHHSGFQLPFLRSHDEYRALVLEQCMSQRILHARLEQDIRRQRME